MFARSGAALGRALAHVSNIVNPNRLIVYMPAALAQPEANTAAAAYRAAVEREAASAFSASGQPGYLTVRPLPARPEDAALLGAKAAAICVLESFIEHALRLDGCMTTLRRPSSGTGEFKVLKALTGRAGERIAQAGVDPFHECLRAPGPSYPFLTPACRTRRNGKRAGNARENELTGVSVRGPPAGHAEAPPCGPHGLRERCLVRPVRSIVR